MVNATSEAARPPLIELKNGKIIFKQKSSQLDKFSETLQEIVRFRELLAQATEPILSIPIQHHSLIGKLAFESDKTLHFLSKSIRSQLLPESIEVDKANASNFENLLPLSAVESALLLVAERINYGLEHGQYGLSKLPTALCLWRWEVKDPSNLPIHFRDKAEERKRERTVAREYLKLTLDAMTPEQRASSLGIKANVNLLESSTASRSGSAEGTIPLYAATGSKDEGNLETSCSLSCSIQSPETSQVKVEAPRISNRTQKALQEDASTKKSAAAFAKFFTKRQPVNSNFVQKQEASNSKENTQQIHSQSDFDRTFHPFLPRKNMTLAPTNWFVRRRDDLIIIDSEDTLKSQTTPQELLAQNIRSLPPGLREPRPKQKSAFKSCSKVSVREVMEKLTNAEVSGDEANVKYLLALLRNRRRIPAKSLTFKEDVRPGYLGTWTRSSRCIGPRTPFAKDPAVLDYSYDSGEEWEEDEEGEEVLSGSDSEAEGSDNDSIDDWLVDDDVDVGGEQMNLDDLDMIGYELPERKRKPSPNSEQNRGKEKRRKFVQPLVPFVKGPYWESLLGECEWDGLLSYRIQIFNSSVASINPFKYVSEIPKLSNYRECSNVSQAAGANVQDHAYSSSMENNGGESHLKVAHVNGAQLSIFPEEHFKALLIGIQNCKTASLNVLIDTLYQELKKRKVKKNSIERKVREIAEKRLDAEAGIKIWTVKEEYL